MQIETDIQLSSKIARSLKDIQSRQDRLTFLWQTNRQMIEHKRRIATPDVMSLDQLTCLPSDAVPSGSMVVLIAPQAKTLLDKLQTEIDADISTSTMDILEGFSRLALKTKAIRWPISFEDILSAVDISYHGRLIASVAVDRALGFNLLHFPYQGGSISNDAFSLTEYVIDDKADPMDVFIIFRAPKLSQIEQEASELVSPNTVGIDSDLMPYAFIGEIAKGIGDVAKVAAEGAAAGAAGAFAAAKVMGQGAAEAVVPVAEEVGQGAAAAVEAAAPVVEAVTPEAAVAAILAFKEAQIRATIFGTLKGIRSEATIDELLQIRNELLIDNQNKKS